MNPFKGLCMAFLLIEADYEDRLSSAEDKETVTRRSPQEIMDERFNKP